MVKIMRPLHSLLVALRVENGVSKTVTKVIARYWYLDMGYGSVPCIERELNIKFPVSNDDTSTVHSFLILSTQKNFTSMFVKFNKESIFVIIIQ